MTDKENESELVENPSRRSFLEVGSAAIAGAAFAGLTAALKSATTLVRRKAITQRAIPGRRIRLFWPRTQTPTRLLRRITET